MYQLQWGSSK